MSGVTSGPIGYESPAMATSSVSPVDALSESPRRADDSDKVTQAAGAVSSVRVVSLIGLAHAFSHFFQLVLPPLFPVLKDEFGVSYTELGLIMTLFYTTSGLAQTPSGFLVDRF